MEQKAKLSTKLETKPIYKKIERRSAVRPLIVTTLQEEEQYLHKNRPRLGTKPIFKKIQGQKLYSSLLTETKEKLELKTKPLLGQLQKQNQSLLIKQESGLLEGSITKLGTVLTPRQAQKFIQVPNEAGKPISKQIISPAERQKQPQKQIPKIPILPPPKKPILIFGEPPGQRKERKEKPDKEGTRFNFIGNATRLEGLERREDIIYGRKSDVLARKELGFLFKNTKSKKRKIRLF